jgi:hypothetical protein
LHNVKVNNVINTNINTQATLCRLNNKNMTNLILLLEEIYAGKHVFSPEGDTLIDINAFQRTAKLLADAEQRGYLLGYYPMHAGSTKHCWCELVMVEGLRLKGEQFLSSQISVN